MAKALADKKIKVALITETAVYAVMSRINKIFVGSSIILNFPLHFSSNK
jgi:translation initiation factor 2B subunit (eIF-2B alpha/beta/delta family)